MEEHLDPNSYSWCLMRYALFRLINNSLLTFLPQIGLELQGLCFCADPEIYYLGFLIYAKNVYYPLWIMTCIWMASCTSGLTHIKKTVKINVFDSNNSINIRVSHSGLDHLVTDFVTFLCSFVFIRLILYFMLQRDFFSKSSKCGLDHLCMMPSIWSDN